MTRTKAREMVASILRDGTNRKQRATQFARDVRDAIESIGNSKALERPLHQHFPTACAPLLPSTPTLRALGSLLEPQAQSDLDPGRPRSRSYTKSDSLLGSRRLWTPDRRQAHRAVSRVRPPRQRGAKGQERP